MRQSHDEEWLLAELRELGERLRDERPKPSPLELDRIKTRAMKQASRVASPRMKGAPMKSRLVSILVVAGLLVGGTSGVLAATGGIPGSGAGSSSAAKTQYCPPSSPGGGKPKHGEGGNKCGHSH
jgi:hypothetical protein